MSSGEPHEEENPVLGQDPDSPSPEFFAWVASMTSTERMDVLKRFYSEWDPPAAPSTGAVEDQPTAVLIEK